MPNWCVSHIRFSGKQENIDTLHKRLTANVKLRKRDGGSWWAELEPAEHTDSSVGALFARTLEFDDLGASCAQAEYGYYESIACIGSKWDPEFIIAETTPTTIALVLESAWSPVLRGLVLIGKKYDVSVRVEYEEPGCDFGGVLVYDADKRSVADYFTKYLHWRWLGEHGEYDNVEDFIAEYYGERREQWPATVLAEASRWFAVESVDEFLGEEHDVDEWLEQELRANTLLRV